MTQTTDTARGKPQAGTNRVPTVPTLPKLGVDAGNRYIKYATHHQAVNLLPACYRELEEWDETAPGYNSITIRYERGGCFDLVGKRWVVGRQASDLGGKHVFKTEKADVMPYSLLAAIAASVPKDASAVNISTLVCALPDHRDKSRAESIRQAMHGTHFIQIDNRQQVTVRIGAVSVRAEGTDAYRWLRSTHAYSAPERINGVLDFGGGTTLATLYRSSGQMIAESRLNLPGAFRLAQTIATALAGKGLEPKGTSPRVELILDAIADGSYAYGTTGHNFRAEFQSASDRWIEGIREDIKTQWSSWFGEIGTVAMIGGSAPLALKLAERTSGRMFVAEQPALATVRGMLL